MICDDVVVRDGILDSPLSNGGIDEELPFSTPNA